MLTPKEKLNDILDALQAVIDHKKVPILESEVRTIAMRLVQYHTAQGGLDLFRVIHAIAMDTYFPSGVELEHRVRARLGMAPLKGLTEEKIGRFEHENVLAGQSVKNAKAGAEMMRNTLKKAPIPAEKPKSVEKDALDLLGELDSAEPEVNFDELLGEEKEEDPLSLLDAL